VEVVVAPAALAVEAGRLDLEAVVPQISASAMSSFAREYHPAREAVAWVCREQCLREPKVALLADSRAAVALREDFPVEAVPPAEHLASVADRLRMPLTRGGFTIEAGADMASSSTKVAA